MFEIEPCLNISMLLFEPAISLMTSPELPDTTVTLLLNVFSPVIVCCVFIVTKPSVSSLTMSPDLCLWFGEHTGWSGSA